MPIAYLVSLTVFIPAAGWLGDRFGGRRVLLGAIALFTAGSILAGLSTSLNELAVSKADTGQASSIFNAGKQLGSAVCVALLTTVLAAAVRTQQVTGHLAANLTGYHAGFLTAAAAALIAIPVALSIHDADAANTMTRP